MSARQTFPSHKPTIAPLPSPIFNGFYASGTDISLSVPRGTNRLVQVFLYLPPVGTTTCPTWNVATTDYTSVYFVGSASGIDTTSDRTIDITASFPGTSNNLVVQQKLSQSCGGITLPTASVNVSTNKWGLASVPVTLSAASNTSTAVSYATQDGTAIHGVHYLTTAGTLMIPLGRRPAPSPCQSLKTINMTEQPVFKSC